MLFQCLSMQVAQLTVLFVTFLLLQLFKSRSRNCSPAYFVLFVTQAVLCACATAVFLWRAATQQKQVSLSRWGWKLDQPTCPHKMAGAPPSLRRAPAQLSSSWGAAKQQQQVHVSRWCHC